MIFMYDVVANTRVANPLLSDKIQTLVRLYSKI